MDIKIERSTARHKSVAGRVKNGVLVITAPAEMSEAELAPIVERLRVRIEHRTARATLDDHDLMHRTQELSHTYFAGRLCPTSVRWVTNQNLSRWASCTTQTGEIRISHRLARVPAFVLDAVLVHELVHLEIGGHGANFWKMANRFPLMERARGYLLALSGQEDDEM